MCVVTCLQPSQMATWLKNRFQLLSAASSFGTNTHPFNLFQLSLETRENLEERRLIGIMEAYCAHPFREIKPIPIELIHSFFFSSLPSHHAIYILKEEIFTFTS